MDRIPASSQFAAIAYLRWRLFANAFRRKGGKGELAAQIIVYPIALIFLAIPILLSGLGSWYVVSRGHFGSLTAIFWGVSILHLLVSINISAPGLSFDPQSLIRFPLSFPRFLTVRIFLGLLSASTITGTLSLLAVAVGTTVARPGLAPPAFAAALALAWTNMLFIRMIFAWVDRWLSTRRARELFTGVVLLGSIGIQYLRFAFTGSDRGSDSQAQLRRIHAAGHLYHRARPILNLLPPGLAGRFIAAAAAGAPGLAAAALIAILLFSCVFLAIFGWRMYRDYRGENLSEVSQPTTRPGTLKPAKEQVHPSSEPGNFNAAFSSTNVLSPVISACLQKEALYIRRNVSQLYGVMGPVLMVVVFAGRLGSVSRTGLVFPSAMAYAFLGIAALSYNSLGLDGTGVQGYFLAPIRMRDVILAKNLIGFAIAGLQLLLVYLVVTFTAGRPPLALTLATVSWVVFAVFANTAVGNMRSLTSPRKMDPTKVTRRQASGMSALLSVAIMLAIAGLGAGLLLSARFLVLPWLPVPILLALALGAFALYYAGLNRIDAFAYNHRETILEELTKAS